MSSTTSQEPVPLESPRGVELGQTPSTCLRPHGRRAACPPGRCEKRWVGTHFHVEHLAEPEAVRASDWGGTVGEHGALVTVRQSHPNVCQWIHITSERGRSNRPDRRGRDGERRSGRRVAEARQSASGQRSQALCQATVVDLPSPRDRQR